MNSHLQSLHQSYVFAYILNYQPPASSSDNGVMTIVDNSENNVTSLLSQYGFYIDNVFIAGGYGFKTLEDLQKAQDVANDFENFTYNLNNALKDLSNKQTIFVFKGTEEAEIGSQEVNLNILSPEYNTYNYITTYQYFKLTEETNLNASNIKYILSLKTQSDIRYVDNINIINNNDDENDVIEIEDLTTVNAQKYKIKVNIHQNTSSNILQYNDDLNIYVYSKVNEEFKDTPITLTNTENISKDIEFNRPASGFIDDLVIEIRKPGANVGEENVIYSYIIHDFLRWQDKFIIYPTPGTDALTQYNKYNFRDTDTDINDSNCYSIYQQLIQDNFIEDNYINADTNNEIELNFSSNIPCYDYIIFRNQYDLEFYFNGLQSHNWVYETITVGSQQYYIWQSPQRYIGNHTWKIKIKMQ